MARNCFYSFHYKPDNARASQVRNIGVIEGNKLVCAWHGWQWDPTTGEAVHNPSAKVAVYPIKIEGGDVMVEL